MTNLAELTQTKMASILPMTARSLRESKAPRLPNGKYDPAAVIAWLIEREKKKAAGQTNQFSDELERYRAAQADLSELRLKREKRELIPVEDVRECFDTICDVWVAISKKLQATGHREAWLIVEQHLKEALKRFDESAAARPTATTDE